MTSATHKSAQNLQAFFASYLADNPGVVNAFNEQMAKKAIKKAQKAKEGLVPSGCARVYTDMGGAVLALVPMPMSDAMVWARAAASMSSRVFVETMVEACESIQFDPSRRGFNYRPVLRRGEPIILRVNSQGYMVPVSGAVETVVRFRSQGGQEQDPRDSKIVGLIENVLAGKFGGESTGSIKPHIRRPASLEKPADVKFGRLVEAELSSDEIAQASSGVVSWGQRHNYIAVQLERLANWELWSRAYTININSPLQKTREQLVEVLFYELPKRYEGEELAEENEEVLLREVRDYWKRIGSVYNYLHNLYFRSIVDEYMR